jgi:hypothetical protein
MASFLIFAALALSHDRQTSYDTFVRLMQVEKPVSLRLIHSANYLIAIGEARAVKVIFKYDDDNDARASQFLCVAFMNRST